MESKRNIRITIEYDGANYVGWQRQKNGVSVQEKVEEALSAHLRERIKVTAAGRTDSGVHALGQVISFRTASRLRPRAIQLGALPYLPSGITFLDAEEVAPGFSARRSARLRWYRYYILNRGVGPAVGTAYLTHVPFRLDMDRMNAAAAVLAGEHDFRAFRAATCTAKRTYLLMHEPRIQKLPESILLMDFRCQSFLQNMVRIMAGTIVACGRGKLSVTDVQEMLRSGKRIGNAVTLPPNGLFLYRVFYGEEEMPEE